MTLTDQVIKNIITRVVKSEDYRIEIVNLINAEFLQFSIDFFKKVVNAKLNSEDITIDWYRQHFMATTLPSDDIAINAGLNMKTISNMYGSATRSIVIEASNEHFESLYQSIQTLVEIEEGIDLTLTIKLKGVSVDLNVSESLIVINTLAVKRAALRGGLWSTAGKSAEKYLMLTLCKLYQVPESNYDATHFVKDKGKKVDREIDFYLLNGEDKYLCEVKLMGKGNPESADAVIARYTNVFVGDTLSLQNKNQCDQLGVHWVALRDRNGYQRFGEALQALGIPHQPYNGNLDDDLPEIVESLFE
ncbi:CfrBI family restriction endonuclease [Capnocytophaga sp. oral taxon 380]|jgi:putative type II site-specific deoxyribonuclease|uniref:CfrBI family restriction endonuclease n=1 Tax=Capnocytophaga sp. oral taxon 380 TaxID=712217 RepID=UPI0002A1B600|nr:CfrBI family restriction endonuclease [Capnocytophaga sp. oral taxon 380]EKY05932.1 CfrBI restriction endonuclease [Capnocytophaga sp. oral taxon 380 str. F0488]